MTEANSEPVYQLTENGVKRLIDNAMIPDCSENRDWQDYQAWLAEGNTPRPAPAPAPDQTVALANGAAREQRRQKKEESLKNTEVKSLKTDLLALKTSFYSQMTGD